MKSMTHKQGRRLSLAQKAVLVLEDVTCPICLSILVEPVSLPCHHALCLACFKEHVSITSLACPVCRTRISVWVRKNAKTDTLVDTKLWQAIQRNFPDQVEARQAGREVEDSEGNIPPVLQRVCQPGEIRQEYEDFLAKLTQEENQRKSKEETASLRLIQQLQEEEKTHQQERVQQQQQQHHEDFLIAQQMEEMDMAQLDSHQKTLQELCAKDEDLARQLEVAESTTLRPQNKGKTSKGPMDLFLNTNARPQSESCSPSGTQAGTSRLLRHLNSNSSESESEDSQLAATPHHRHYSAPGKENAQGRQHSSPLRTREAAKGKRMQHFEELSPEIDTYSFANTTSKHRKAETRKRSYGTLREEDSTSTEEENDDDEEEEQEEEEESRGGRGDESGNSAVSVPDLPILKYWEKDKESLAALMMEQQRAEAQLQQELQDRLLAEALQKEYDAHAYKVVRTKGSEDQYSLRNRKADGGSSSLQQQQQAGPSKTKGVKRQATLSEVLSKHHKSA